MTTPPPPELPVPTFLEHTPGSEYEVRAWVAAAREAVTALQSALFAAIARAEHAERRLAETRPVTIPGPSGAVEQESDSSDLRSPMAEAQARFQASTDAAATVMTEARAILRDAREGLTPPHPAPQALPALALPSPSEPSVLPQISGTQQLPDVADAVDELARRLDRALAERIGEVAAELAAATAEQHHVEQLIEQVQAGQRRVDRFVLAVAVSFLLFAALMSVLALR